jgi:hypothetical protein
MTQTTIKLTIKDTEESMVQEIFDHIQSDNITLIEDSKEVLKAFFEPQLSPSSTPKIQEIRLMSSLSGLVLTIQYGTTNAGRPAHTSCILGDYIFSIQYSWITKHPELKPSPEVYWLTPNTLAIEFPAQLQVKQKINTQ